MAPSRPDPILTPRACSEHFLCASLMSVPLWTPPENTHRHAQVHMAHTHISLSTFHGLTPTTQISTLKQNKQNLLLKAFLNLARATSAPLLCTRAPALLTWGSNLTVYGLSPAPSFLQHPLGHRSETPRCHQRLMQSLHMVGTQHIVVEWMHRWAMASQTRQPPTI